jgi:hypothetical protein
MRQPLIVAGAIFGLLAVYALLCMWQGTVPNMYVFAGGIALGGIILLTVLIDFLIYLASERCQICRSRGCIRTTHETVLEETFGQQMLSRPIETVDAAGRRTLAYVTVPVTLKKTLVEELRTCTACNHGYHRSVWRVANQW